MANLQGYHTIYLVPHYLRVGDRFVFDFSKDGPNAVLAVVARRSDGSLVVRPARGGERSSQLDAAYRRRQLNRVKRRR